MGLVRVAAPLFNPAWSHPPDITPTKKWPSLNHLSTHNLSQLQLHATQHITGLLMQAQNRCKAGFFTTQAQNRCKAGFFTMQAQNRCKADFVTLQTENRYVANFFQMPAPNKCFVHFCTWPNKVLVSYISEKWTCSSLSLQMPQHQLVLGHLRVECWLHQIRHHPPLHF